MRSSVNCGTKRCENEELETNLPVGDGSAAAFYMFQPVFRNIPIECNVTL